MNPFDAGLNGYPLDGFSLKKSLKKVKSAVKKIGRPDKIVKSAAKEIKRSSKKVVAEVKRSPVAKVALVAGAAMLYPPAAAAIKGVVAKMAASKGGAIAAKAASAAAKSSTVKKAIVKKGIETIVKNKQEKAGKKSAKKFADNVKKIEKINQTIQNNPKFAEVVQKMQAAGASEQDIIKAWASSDEYRKIALPEVQNIATQEVYENLVSSGVPEQQAQTIANQQGAVVAENAVNEIQEKAGETKGSLLIPIVATVAAFALFGGA